MGGQAVKGLTEEDCVDIMADCHVNDLPLGSPRAGMPDPEACKQFNEGMEGKIRSNGTIIKESLKQKNHHPTVKPLSLMRYLCRLVCPPGGLVLDPFGGSGTTGIAAIQEGFHYILIEKEADYCEIARRRIAAVPARLDSFREAKA